MSNAENFNEKGIIIFTETRELAEKYRKNKQYTEAKKVFLDLWKEDKTEAVGAGLLHCYRHLKEWDAALELADEIVPLFPNLNWARNEAAWAYIQGLLYTFDDSSSPEVISKVTEKIVKISPYGATSNVAILYTIKLAKNAGNWKMMEEWVGRVDPLLLNPEPIILENGKEGWSEKARWLNYQIISLIENGKPKKAFAFSDAAIAQYPKQYKFFQRNKARACACLGDHENAAAQYKALREKVRGVDYWILQEYAISLSEIGEDEESIKIWCLAAQSSQKSEYKVSFFEEMGDFLLLHGYKDEALHHYWLSAYVREGKRWSVPSELTGKIAALKGALAIQDNSSYREVLGKCQNFWNKFGEDRSGQTVETTHKKNKREHLQGIITLGPSDRQFCFINTLDRESFICFKNEFTGQLEDNSEVVFTAIPSFDKKKGRESWKAVDIQKKVIF